MNVSLPLIMHHLPGSVTFLQHSNFLLKQFNILQTKNVTKTQRLMKFRNISIHVFKIQKIERKYINLPTISFSKRKITSSFIYWNCLEAEVRKSPSLICGIYGCYSQRTEFIFLYPLKISVFFSFFINRK